MRKGQKGPSLRVFSHAKIEWLIGVAFSAAPNGICNNNNYKTKR
jgi:hypothetical protein